MKKYVMYLGALLSLYYLSQFLLKGYQLWELFGIHLRYASPLIYLKKF